MHIWFCIFGKSLAWNSLYFETEYLDIDKAPKAKNLVDIVHEMGPIPSLEISTVEAETVEKGKNVAN
ncbi:hypothetical protein CCACVL1_12340 [Corchorus capsularis]|uniref:Uncharacterized protein n=1 Tax=Corchorus capsularis TaxID=210143 RepID=A0A1R3IGA4_COCAP|nr:hypothetical protein CCACVL1_12340 [Corchorus capsularis]